jgi:tetratricopeptide (TPR) repeat protein
MWSNGSSRPLARPVLQTGAKLGINMPDAFDLALHHHQTGDLGRAESLYRQFLQVNPRHADCHHALGVLLAHTDRREAALELIRHAVALNPSAPLHHFSLGTLLKDQGRPSQAAASFRQALALDPNYLDALVNLGIVLREQDRLPEAATAFRQALVINPNHAGVHNNLGLTLMDLGLLKEASACYREALRLQPRYVDALDNLGVALKDQGNLTEAAENCREALRIDPNFANAHNSLGVICQSMGKWHEALASYERAVHLKPDHASARWNRALMKLSLGDLKEAWPDYEFRWQVSGFCKRHEHRPTWDGTPLADKTLLLYSEQGLGDTLQFVRYAPLVKQLGGTVLLECQPELVNLLKEVPGVDAVFARDLPLPPFDVQSPLLSLPGLFGTTLATIPASIPYIRRAPRRKPAGDALSVGIAWQGSSRHPSDRLRSFPLTHFAALAKVSRVQLASLQVGSGSEQLASASFPIIDLGSRFDPNSFDDLAAAVANLDLVITADTAVAHLAGAMGVPVWVALPFAPDWRWLLERSDSPWYPTMRLFRQTRPSAWEDVFQRIAVELS